VPTNQKHNREQHTIISHALRPPSGITSAGLGSIGGSNAELAAVLCSAALLFVRLEEVEASIANSTMSTLGVGLEGAELSYF